MISMGDALFQTGFHSLPKDSNCAVFVTRDLAEKLIRSGLCNKGTASAGPQDAPSIHGGLQPLLIIAS
jgi:hypothetical protein